MVGALVPETPVYEDGDALLWKGHIWTRCRAAGPDAVVHAIPKASSVQECPEISFRLRVAAPGESQACAVFLRSHMPQPMRRGHPEAASE